MVKNSFLHRLNILDKALIVIFVFLFIGIGVIISLSHALGSSSSNEIESGQLTSKAHFRFINSASNNSAVRFGPQKIFGTAVTSSQLNDINLVNILEKYGYTTLTPIYEMKFASTEPAQNQFDFTGGDRIVAFAQNHNMSVHGHTLIWHNSLPSWLTTKNWTRSQLSVILNNHISSLLAHYATSSVKSWDVVNEALNDDGSMRADIWSNTLGPTYIEQAFETAHRADPTVKLYYNDYNIELTNAKSNALYVLVSNFKQRHIPIDGIGFQMHKNINSNLSMSDLAANMQRFTDLGLDVSISEMDVAVGTNSPTPEDLTAQANFYKNVAQVCAANPHCVRFSSWGVSDKYSQIKLSDGSLDAALLFDTNYSPKPAINNIEDIL